MVSNAVWRQDMREGNVARKTLDDRTSGEGGWRVTMPWIRDGCECDVTAGYLQSIPVVL